MNTPALRTHLAFAHFLRIFLFLIFYEPQPAPQAKVTIQYWEKWTGFEANATRVVVNDFNAGQNRIFVDYTSVSDIDRKLMLATAGGVPPDMAGLYSRDRPVDAENNALTPLDGFARRYQIKPEN